MKCSLMEKKTLSGTAIYIPASMGRTFELKIKIFFSLAFLLAFFTITKKNLNFYFQLKSWLVTHIPQVFGQTNMPKQGNFI